jgi:beta-lactamase superfamily II metal-dependent hydrolase
VPVLPGPPGNLAGDARAWLPTENDRSVVLAPQADGWAVLLPGDLERAGEAAVLDVLPDHIAAVAIPHHGSRSSSTLSFVRRVSAAVAVAQAGHRNRYRHPTQAVMARWRESGARTWRTDRDGTVELTVGRGELRVRTWRWDRGWRVDAAWPLTRDPWRQAGLAATAPQGHDPPARVP